MSRPIRSELSEAREGQPVLLDISIETRDRFGVLALPMLGLGLGPKRRLRAELASATLLVRLVGNDSGNQQLVDSRKVERRLAGPNPTTYDAAEVIASTPKKALYRLDKGSSLRQNGSVSNGR